MVLRYLLLTNIPSRLFFELIFLSNAKKNFIALSSRYDVFPHDYFHFNACTIKCTEKKSTNNASVCFILFCICLVHVMFYTSTIHFIITDTSLTYHFVLVLDRRRSDCFARQSHPDSEFSFPLPGPGVSFPPLPSPNWPLIPHLARQMRAEADTTSQPFRLLVELPALIVLFLK